ncbi:hypothetical protein MYP_381 [Sporocytophaga myxococcoides]|uniref:Uncharacterized protein n=1 Tax=Sporocytophaga myxococcoides TaxID=153721 RepID=A0A098L8K8_9BACT|nr:hypothetical protein [Sporocytophaga myxococcoides]GAL83155.1 hypothetical protein MYP_381 [Sporocytophaga myxococcoides]
MVSSLLEPYQHICIGLGVSSPISPNSALFLAFLLKGILTDWIDAIALSDGINQIWQV